MELDILTDESVSKPVTSTQTSARSSSLPCFDLNVSLEDSSSCKSLKHSATTHSSSEPDLDDSPFIPTKMYTLYWM